MHSAVNWNKFFQQYIAIPIEAGQQNSLTGAGVSVGFSIGFELCIPTRERGNEAEPVAITHKVFIKIVMLINALF